ncbi:hypothetical protein WNY59_12585 [Ahrensia kielensis]|uniref:Phage shock protein B n=1 Tax=Ahrensia kielensis TaxID=76980 RepID=A0ABU9T8I2_9HYPH
MEAGPLIGTLLPFAVLFGGLFLFLRATNRHYQKHVHEVNSVNQKIADTNREMIAELREIKQLLKDRH